MAPVLAVGRARYFYPRSPCGERLSSMLYDTTSLIFLSTLSLRRATRRSVKLFRQNYISIHALLAESDPSCPPAGKRLRYFYPRSPCGERHFRRAFKRPIANFYPRSPCGERLNSSVNTADQEAISIHALLAESDHPSLCGTARHIYFYPRSPCGERPCAGCLRL